MKKMVIILFIFLQLFFFNIIYSAAASPLYIQYSENMCNVLKNSAERNFAQQVLGSGREVILFSGITNFKSGSVAQYSLGIIDKEKLGALFNCMVKKPYENAVGEQCPFIEKLERKPDKDRANEFNFLLNKAKSGAGILFTAKNKNQASNINISYLEDVLKENKSDFFIIASKSREEKSKLFYLVLNENPYKNKAAFVRDAQIPQKNKCALRCNRGREVDFYGSCFKKGGAYILNADFKFLYRGKYIKCDRLKPNFQYDLSYLSFPYTEKFFLKGLTVCSKSKESITGAGMRMQANLTLSRAVKKEFYRLPNNLKKMLTSLVGMSAQEYIEPFKRSYNLLITGCN